jgi:hypothetical protein
MVATFALPTAPSNLSLLLLRQAPVRAAGQEQPPLTPQPLAEIYLNFLPPPAVLPSPPPPPPPSGPEAALMHVAAVSCVEGKLSQQFFLKSTRNNTSLICDDATHAEGGGCDLTIMYEDGGSCARECIQTFGKDGVHTVAAAIFQLRLFFWCKARCICYGNSTSSFVWHRHKHRIAAMESDKSKLNR